MSTIVKSLELFTAYGGGSQFFSARVVVRGLNTSEFTLSFPVRNRYEIYLN
jgi:hypothetical protein